MTPPSPLSPLVGADREMPHEPSRLLVAGDLHADESWFENLVYYAREQRCQAILQLGDLGYWPRIKHYQQVVLTSLRGRRSHHEHLLAVDVFCDVREDLVAVVLGQPARG